MKVFHIISHFDLGGAEKVAFNISKSNNEEIEYHLFEVIKTNSEFTQSFINDLEKNNILYHRSPIKSKKIAICFFWIWFIIQYIKFKPEIIHVHTEIPDMALWIFRKISFVLFWIRPKYVRTIHNTNLWSKWEKIGRIVEKFYLKHNCNIAISKAVQRTYFENYGGNPAEIIYNGLEIEDQKSFPYIIKGKKNILFAGRFEEQKGINELLNIIDNLKENEDFYFHVIGNGSLKTHIFESIQNKHNVKLYPPMHNLSKYLGSFEYVLMPSNYEGFGLLSVEASLAHTPTIINKCIGLKETLPNDWPLAINNNSINEYIELFNHKLELFNYSDLCAKANSYANNNFSIQEMQRKYEHLYYTLLKRR